VRNNINKKDEELIFRFLNDELGAAEIAELETRLNKDSTFRENFNEYRTIWFHPDFENKNEPSLYEEAYHRFQSKIHSVSHIRRIITNPFVNIPLRITAAILIGVMLITSLLYSYEKLMQKNTALAITETIVPMGSLSEMILSDGSLITLNAGSRVRFDSEFGRKNRNIYLTGEAYFKVKPFTKLPFVVHAGNIEIKALGTEFNVSAYPEDNRVEALLLEGKIAVHTNIKGKQSSVILEPNQRIVYQKDKNNLVLEKNPKDKTAVPDQNTIRPEKNEVIIKVEQTFNPQALVSWKEENWIINNERLDALAVKLERKYDVQITFTDKSLLNFRFSGTLKNETLEQVLEVIKLTSPVLYEIKGKSVTFSEDREKKKRYEKIYNLNN
jgi:transmembrane sensor